MALMVTLTGHLLAPPEVRYAKNQAGTPYTRIRVALNKKHGEEKLFAVVDVTIFKFAEAAKERLRQGSRILVAGSAFPKWYETKENEVVAGLDVVADHWECLDPKPEVRPTPAEASRSESPRSGSSGRRSAPARRRSAA